ncbi:hypothetical protein A3C87_00210 [Candidatus Kaiserbacteria bacterium RIFCSPHIGHO2_02_FULL_49_34]|uniref:Uncharacterized protein n=1 Tax=Candidatus Kaiserbacteria bacterium RIFCSPHIGHO2_02_FULL_49_34 TaxID=1798491 RepID=A0A1F6DJ44_9BACT|nr:MAG: hypothetical protein A3C87_00210 [Candidatus Kaiserbacteria bacterium RIFCSPHIGHO2_02_FULL_49_34]
MNKTQTFFAEKIANACITTADKQQIDLDNENPKHWLIDLRKATLSPEVLDCYATDFFERYADQYPFQVAGLETAAISLVAAIVMKSKMLNMPVNGFYIRKSRSKRGLLSMVEGEVQNKKVILVDDIMNSGNSFIRQIEVLEKLRVETPSLDNLSIASVFSIVRFRDHTHYSYFTDKNIDINSILDLNDLNPYIKESAPQLDLHNIKNITTRLTPNNFTTAWHWKGSKPNYFYVIPKSSPLYFNKSLYFGTDSGHFTCLDSLTGKEKWSHLVPFGSKKKLIFSSPCLVHDRGESFICFGAYDGNLYLLNAETGKRKWIFMEADWIGSSPCFSEKLGLVFSGMEYGLFKKQGGVTAIDVHTGKKRWEYRSEYLTHGSPAYSQKYNIIACGSNDKYLHVLNAKTGELLWKHETILEIKYAPCIDEETGCIIFGGIGGNEQNDGRSTVYVCDIKTGHIRAQYNDLYFGIYSTPMLYKNLVIVTGLDKCIHAFHRDTGEAAWKYETPARIFASPIIIDDRLYIGQNSGHFYEINPETGQVTSLSHFTERITNKAAYDPETNTFFVPTFANEIYAIKDSMYE